MTPRPGTSATILLMIALAAVAVSSAVPANVPTPPVPVARVDLARYVGLWHEIARIPNRFQGHCARDITARYEILKDGRIGVINSCVGKDGKVSQAVGIAKVIDAETNARLKVSFFSILGIRPFWGDYWILGLGDDYEFAVIGTPNRKYGWILARTPHPTPETLEKAWRVLKEQGYAIERFQRSSAD